MERRVTTTANNHKNSGKNHSKSNPATLDRVGYFKVVSPEEISNIVRHARAAQEKWMSYSVKKRIKILKRANKYITKNLEEIAHIISQETGKPKIESINADIFSGISAAVYGLDEIKRIFKRRKINFGKLNILLKLMGRSSYIAPRPIGVIGIISPWNYPFGIPYSQTILAVTAGNAVILKPSSETPFTGLKIQEIFDKSGFPEGIVQAVPGSGSTTGNALIESNVDRIIFTGSVSVGKMVMEKAAQRLTPVTLELGGKDPFIICEDADLERATKAAVWGAFLNSGQTCVGTKRIYVQEDIYDDFLELFKDKVESLTQGYGWEDPDVDVGPLINEKSLHEMEEHVSRAIAQGGKILTGGKRNDDLRGYYFEPTVVTHANQDMDVVQEEIFGPIVVVLPYKTDEDAIRMANDSKFALSGAVWTTDIERGQQIAEQITSGTVDVNNVGYTYGLAATPWGGSGYSGFGRTHGELGFHELMEPHHIHTDKQRFANEFWWHPYSKEKLESSKMIFDVVFNKRWLKTPALMKKLLKILRKD